MSERLLIVSLLTALNIDPFRVAQKGWTVTEIGDGEAIVYYDEFDLDKFGKRVLVENKDGSVSFARTRKTFTVTASTPRPDTGPDVWSHIPNIMAKSLEGQQVTLKVGDEQIRAIVKDEIGRAAMVAKGAKR
ncbi:hypothetical protein [Nakamurella lactea]|uniref:hypothetical protein n=1 Tax=Nakamurella lactea TaxID=459515 RepID=UPI000428D6EF|nr:hypothetical protein [Nakamurella lactea]